MQNKLKNLIKEMLHNISRLKASQKSAITLLGVFLVIFGFAVTVFAGNQMVTQVVGQANLICPNGGVLNGNNVCVQPLSCPTGYVYNSSNNLCEIKYLSFVFCEFFNAKGSRTQTFANGGFGGVDPVVLDSPQELSANCNSNNGIPFGTVAAAKTVNLNFQSGRYLNFAICDYEGKGGVHYQTFFSSTSGGVDPLISNSKIDLSENCPRQIRKDLEIDNKKSLSLDLYAAPILNLAVCDYKDSRSDGTAMFQTMADNRDGGKDPVVSDKVIDLASSCDRKAGDHDNIYARRNLSIKIRQPGTCPPGTVLTNGNSCTQSAVNNSFILGVNNIGTGDCNGQSYGQNTFFNCNFPLNGSPNGQYVLPTNGIQAALTYGTVSNCQVNAQTLVCNGIGADINLRNPDPTKPRFGNNIDVILTENNWSTVSPQARINILPANQNSGFSNQSQLILPPVGSNSISSSSNSTARIALAQNLAQNSVSSTISSTAQTIPSSASSSSVSQSSGSPMVVGVQKNNFTANQNTLSQTNTNNANPSAGTVRSGGLAMMAVFGSTSFGIGGAVIYNQKFGKRNKLKTF